MIELNDMTCYLINELINKKLTELKNSLNKLERPLTEKEDGKRVALSYTIDMYEEVLRDFKEKVGRCD